MNDRVNWLVTILYNDSCTLLKCAVSIDRKYLSEDCIRFPLQRGNREIIRSLLPAHVSSCGMIVDVEEIFEVCMLIPVEDN